METTQELIQEQFWEEKYQKLIIDIKKEFPNFAIVQKKYSKFNQMLGKLTFWNNQMNERYTTTLGPKIAVNYLWNERSARDRYGVLIHERIHMRQTQKFGLLAFFLIYALVPFPTKIAYYRRKWEAEPYRINIFLSYKEGGRKKVFSEKYQKYILDQFCGPFYMWTWHSQRDILKWLVRNVRDIESGKLSWHILTNYKRLPSNARPLDSPKILKWLYPEDFA